MACERRIHCVLIYQLDALCAYQYVLRNQYNWFLSLIERHIKKMHANKSHMQQEV